MHVSILLFLNLESSAEVLYYNYETNPMLPSLHRKPGSLNCLISGATASQCTASNKINYKITAVKTSVRRRGKV